jgi:hypothetical protein
MNGTEQERQLVEQFADGIAVLLQSVAPKNRDRASKAFGDIYGMLLALRRRVERLEARPEIKYCGTWTADRKYLPGDVTTLGGSMWFCKNATTIRPSTSTGSDAWQLCVKAGRDGRSAKDSR